MDKVSLALAATMVYMASTLVIGYIASKKIKGLADYIVAGRRLGFPLTYGTILATWFGTGLAIGGASMAYLYGYRGVIMDPIGAGVCILLFGLFFAKTLRKMGYMTISDFFRDRYGREMEALSTIIQVIAYMGWMGSLLVSFGYIFNVFLGIPYEQGLLLGVAVTIVYTMLGSMWSVAYTDFIQTILLIIGILILFPAVINAAGGFDAVLASDMVSMDDFSILPQPGWGYLGYFGLIGAAFYISSWLVQGIGSLSCQDLVQRALSARNEGVARNASLAAGLTYILLGLIPATTGILGRIIIPEIDNPDSILPLLGKELLPTIPFIVFTIGLLAALMSSADSAMLIPSTIVVKNLLPMIKRDVGEKTRLLLAKILVPVFTLVSLYIALYTKTIYFLMNLSWELILMVQGIPFIPGIYWKKATREGALAGIAVSIVSWIALILYTLPQTLAVEEELEWAIWDSIYIAAPPALLLGLIVFIVVSILRTKKKL